MGRRKVKAWPRGFESDAVFYSGHREQVCCCTYTFLRLLHFFLCPYLTMTPDCASGCCNVAPHIHTIYNSNFLCADTPKKLCTLALLKVLYCAFSDFFILLIVLRCFIYLFYFLLIKKMYGKHAKLSFRCRGE